LIISEGGFLCRTPIGWRAIFFIQGGLAFLFFLAGYFTIPHTPSDRRYTKGIDLFGGLLSIVGVALFIFALS
jgi:predicted MFS family arabinose efflux permease